jgi:hypothetical protein
MTQQELESLPAGVRIRWDDTDTGTVTKSDGRTVIVWPDGQVTASFDTAALDHCKRNG